MVGGRGCRLQQRFDVGTGRWIVSKALGGAAAADQGEKSSSHVDPPSIA
jgi:hypothetical protein